MSNIKEDVKKIKSDVKYIKKIVEDLQLSLKQKEDNGLGNMMDVLLKTVMANPVMSANQDIKDVMENMTKAAKES